MDCALGKYAPPARIGGKYQLVRPLGEGGMGTVWVAHHIDLDIQVALKLVRSDIDCPETSARLIREAKAAARLDHPAIVRVLDVGIHEQRDPYLVMELLSGENLVDVLGRKGRLRADEAVRIVLPIVSAVDAIHRAGMLHRDIKPENVLLACDGAGRLQPKLIDFGLAKMSAGVDERRITSHGAVLGTPAYLSPERLLGAEASPDDDLWALCVMLYGLIAGVLPFDDSSLQRLVTALLSPPPPLPEQSAADPELGAILERGLGPRDGRFGSARDLGKALAAWAFRRGITHDIAGVSLRSVWLDDDEVRRLSSGPGSSRDPTRPFAWAPTQPPVHDTGPARLAEERTLDAQMVISHRPPPMRTTPGPLLFGIPLLAFLLVISSVLALRSRDSAPAPAMPAAPSLAPEPLVQSMAVTSTAASASAEAPQPTTAPRPPAAPPPRPARRAPPAAHSSAGIELKNPYR